MRMQEIEIHDYARQLLEAHGDKGRCRGRSKRACALEKQGESEQARNLEAHRSGSQADAWAARKLKWRPTGRQELLPAPPGAGVTLPRRRWPLTSRLRPN